MQDNIFKSTMTNGLIMGFCFCKLPAVRVQGSLGVSFLLDDGSDHRSHAQDGKTISGCGLRGNDQILESI